MSRNVRQKKTSMFVASVHTIKHDFNIPNQYRVMVFSDGFFFLTILTRKPQSNPNVDPPSLTTTSIATGSVPPSDANIGWDVLQCTYAIWENTMSVKDSSTLLWAPFSPLDSRTCTCYNNWNKINKCPGGTRFAGNHCLGGRTSGSLGRIGSN